jgi:beta-aspartyl-peptidase (threonine type)
VCAAVEYRGLSLEQAVHEMLHQILRSLGGDGGLIAVDAHGRIVMQFSTEGMFRGARDSDGRREIAIY